MIRAHGLKAGLVLNPATPLESLRYVLDKIDVVLLMSVNPGFGGQKFIPGVLDKIADTRAFLDAHDGQHIRIEVDGGIGPANMQKWRVAERIALSRVPRSLEKTTTRP